MSEWFIVLMNTSRTGPRNGNPLVPENALDVEFSFKEPESSELVKHITSDSLSMTFPDRLFYIPTCGTTC